MKPVTWRGVLKVLPDDETRSYALQRFRAPGFTADSFANKSLVRARMADALTRTEDWLETRYPKRDRTGIKEVRRNLELELE